MNLIIKVSVFYFFIIMTCCPDANGKEKLVIENECLKKTFWFDSNNPQPIYISLFSKQENRLLTSKTPAPYFEFVIGKRLVTANDSIWVFRKHTVRKMQNGGQEHQLVFEGKSKPVEGLQVVLYQQIFEQSALVREKLVLHTDRSSFELNKKNHKLHFRFPAYTVWHTGQMPVEITEIRIATWENKPITFGDKKKGNHMFYPDIRKHSLNDELTPLKGPVSIASDGTTSWFTAYEHASQDNLNGFFDERKKRESQFINDAMQGTKGIFNFGISEDDFKFLGINTQSTHTGYDVSVDILRGGYLDGEKITPGHPYATVWTATGFYKGQDLEKGKAMLRHYLLHQICEKPASRIPEYYYNTWGMQRQDRSKPLRGILTYERIFEEIDYASELGVDIFVLDDGWENTQGEWFAHKTRFPEGLAPIKKRLDEKGMKMGLWFSPMGIDSTTQRYKEHPEWVINDSEGNPIQAQWGHPAFDFVSGFSDVFIQDCKTLIDQGCRFMKWDAINTFYSSLPNLRHGAGIYSDEELRARYEYLLPLFVMRAMEILTDYEPELVIEVDLTEARRAMTGLAPLSQGKVFWMNNGASWYNDYTAYRTKSMRTIINQYAGIIPAELFTYANYPQNVAQKMKYNVHNSLLAGHGFWGNLQLMTTEERKWVGRQVQLSKQVLPYLVEINPQISGKVGDSPEMYSMVNKDKAAGQVIFFSDLPCHTAYTTDINPQEFLAAVNLPYTLEKQQLNMPIHFTENETSVAAFILPGNHSGVSIVSTTAALTDVRLENEQLVYSLGNPGKQTIIWPKKRGKPVVQGSGETEYTVTDKVNHYLVEVRAKSNETRITIQ